MIGLAALLFATAFTGAAFYINAVEHPARMSLPQASARQQWAPAYKRGYVMQASLAVISGLCGLAAWWQSGGPAWLVGAIAILANWPWTLIVIMPVNKRLFALAPTEDATSLLNRWNRLHAGRTLLGILSVSAFVVAIS